jgi:hypothetical protein
MAKVKQIQDFFADYANLLHQRKMARADGLQLPLNLGS